MKFDHRVGRAVFVVAVSVAVFLFSYRWITNPEPRAQRVAEEQAVLAARAAVIAEVGASDLQLVDPLAPDRKVGKGYVYAERPGWAVSGFYRRDEEDEWHPYLLYLDEDLALHSFKAEDDALEIRK